MKKIIKSAAAAAAILLILQGCSYKINNPEKKESTSSSASSEYSSTAKPAESTSSTAATTTASKKSTTMITSSTTEPISESSESQRSGKETTAATATEPKTAATQKKTEHATHPQTSKTTKTAKTTKTVSAPTYINGILIANKTYALPSNYNPGVDSRAQSAFNRMAADAANQGVNLYIVSGFRSYSNQASIYNNYVARDGKAAADRYSARPGHSEHQTGLAFDVNSLSQSFENTKEGKWLAANCHNYGFIIRYPKGKESVTGYMYEPWHIRYLGTDTATAVYNSGLTLEEYLGINSTYQN